MATPSAVYESPSGVMLMTDNRPNLKDRPDLQELVADILALRQLTKAQDFVTKRSQNTLLAKLSPQDLALVWRAVLSTEASKPNESK
jgi:hypothetical protein